jgi:hypothetical protein
MQAAARGHPGAHHRSQDQRNSSKAYPTFAGSTFVEGKRAADAVINAWTHRKVAILVIRPVIA